MRSFSRNLVAVVGRQARTTAIANSDLLDGVGEGQVPKVDRSLDQKTPKDAFTP